MSQLPASGGNDNGTFDDDLRFGCDGDDSVVDGFDTNDDDCSDDSSFSDDGVCNDDSSYNDGDVVADDGDVVGVVVDVVRRRHVRGSDAFVVVFMFVVVFPP